MESIFLFWIFFNFFIFTPRLDIWKPCRNFPWQFFEDVNIILSFREFYNLLVEETPNHETYPLVLRDPEYIKENF